MREIDNIEIRTTAGLPDVQRYDAQLKALIVTKEGTLPGSRGFGLDAGITDLGTVESVNLLTLELSNKVDEFIPEITVADVERSADSKGIIKTRIHIERRV